VHLNFCLLRCWSTISDCIPYPYNQEYFSGSCNKNKKQMKKMKKSKSKSKSNKNKMELKMKMVARLMSVRV